MSKPRIYLAGPSVFHPAAKHLLDYLKDVCAENGLEGVLPAGTEPDLASLPAEDKARRIRSDNIDRLKACDGLIACISPFRGPGAPAATAWEMGFAEALGKPVVAWCEDKTAYLDRVPHDRDEDGRVFCRQHGMLVEDLGLVDSVMLAAAPVAVQPDFDAAVRLAAKLLGVAGEDAA